MSRHSKHERNQKKKVIPRLKRALNRANAWTALKTGTKRGRYPSASEKNIVLYGRNFYHSFPEQKVLETKAGDYVVYAKSSIAESPMELTLSLLKKGRSHSSLASVRFGFEKDAIVVESMKGKSGFKVELKKFNKANSKKAFDTILERMEEHAKSLDFKETKIRIPESLYAYWGSKQYGKTRSA